MAAGSMIFEKMNWLEEKKNECEQMD